MVGPPDLFIYIVEEDKWAHRHLGALASVQPHVLLCRRCPRRRHVRPLRAACPKDLVAASVLMAQHAAERGSWNRGLPV